MSMQDGDEKLGRPTRPRKEPADSQDLRVWDLFVRLVHWSLVLSFAVAWVTGGRWDDPHLAAGYAIVTLVSMGIVWGFVGPQHARFASFVVAPAIVIRFLLQTLTLRAPRHIGHNPAGGAMVLALLATLLVVCASGAIMTTDIFRASELIEDVHEAASTFALIRVGLLVAGVAFASVEHGENLVRSMITGRKRR